ncbi:MAG: 4Fe-4S dicluster domain-containing protein [Lentimicrobium sp.]|nr:4Fe-4S dicluster domain-containing protein [Lentimicrobium sp.]MDD2527076.1 4Fe-4S dicluster domain-containing protein [Lentimicrobiaceae bacterium]
MDKEKKNIKRREFLKGSLVATGALALFGTGAFILDNKAAENIPREDFLRPPGAIDEKDFLYGCIKCGLCVQICPVQAIKLSGATEGLAFGTPYIEPRMQPCDFSCDALQCVETCPTAVLDFKPFKEAGLRAVEEAAAQPGADLSQVNPFEVQKVAMKEEVRIGKARVNKSTCLAHNEQGFKGISRGKDFEGIYRSPNSDATSASPLSDRVFNREICNLCITECPIGEKAIYQKLNRSGKLVPHVLDGCTGCGVCQMVCPTEDASIVVEPY